MANTIGISVPCVKVLFQRLASVGKGEDEVNVLGHEMIDHVLVFGCLGIHDSFSVGYLFAFDVSPGGHFLLEPPANITKSLKAGNDAYGYRPIPVAALWSRLCGPGASLAAAG